MRAHAIRLRPGADLRGGLEQFATANAIRAGCILSAVGSLARVHLRMPGAAGEAEAFATYAEPMEIVGLSGVLSADGLHVHITLSRRDGSCIGGHLMQGCMVHTTAELVVGELPDVAFRRRLDPATGYNELSVEPLGTGDDPSPRGGSA